MNMPNRASRNHFIRSLFWACDSVSCMDGTGCAPPVGTRLPSSCAQARSGSPNTAPDAARTPPWTVFRLDIFMQLSLSGHCPENQSDPRGLAESWDKVRHSTVAGKEATEGTPALFKAITV